MTAQPLHMCVVVQIARLCGVAHLRMCPVQASHPVTKVVLPHNVMGYYRTPATAADVHHGNKHGHHLPCGIVLALPIIGYSSC